MKNTIKFFGIIAFVAVIGFSMAACSGGGDDSGGGIPTKVVYKGMDAAANIYELTISKAANRAAFNPIAGDDYVMTVTPPNNGAGKKSEGTVDQSVDGGYSLKPNGATKVFNVAVDGGNMVAIAGEVKYTDNSTDEKAVGLLPPPASGDTTISGNTFVSGVTVAYDRRIANLTAAKAATSFPYKLDMDNGVIKGVAIADFIAGSSVTVTNGKLTIICGNPPADILEDFKPEDFPGFTVTPNDSKYFGSPDDTLVFMNVGGEINPETSTGYGLICLKNDTDYAGIVYVNQDTKIKGSHVREDASGIIEVMDIDVKAGWNYIFVTQTGKFLTIATSKRLPASYKWTVIDFNFPLEFHGGSDGGDHGGDGPGDGGGPGGDGDGDGDGDGE